MTPQQAQELVKRALSEVAPDADLPSLPMDADFRDVLELDSLDLLNFVERLSDAGGCRIEEDDYPKLTTVQSAAEFLAARTRSG